MPRSDHFVHRARRWCAAVLALVAMAMAPWLTAAAAVAAQGPPAPAAQHAAPGHTAAHAAADGATALPAPDTAAAPPAVLQFRHRHIATLRASQLGRTPAERAAFGQAAMQAAQARGGAGVVTLWRQGETTGVQIDGSIVFYLLPADLDNGSGTPQAAAAEAVRARLQTTLDELAEMRDPRRLAIAVGLSLAATVLAWVLLRGLAALRRRLHVAAERRLQAWHAAHPARSWLATYARPLRSAASGASTLLAWALGLMLLDLWAVFVLGRFALTRPWAERSREWLLDVAGRFFSAIAAAVPGLLTVALIFVLARVLQRAAALALQRVERGELQFAGLDADTAGPTRRIAGFVIWLFALAIAYPFLPGADSEAFKGVSVLAGLMLSLGASGVVGQVVSGLSLMYSRTLRVGEYVKIGEIEGTVSALGLFATKLHTGMGEEVCLPNAVVFGQPVRNFSRLVADGQFVLHTAVTIGYATPWRQVHAMLLEAARRTPGVAQQPAPYVVQTALSDFYVEYRLCAQGSRSAPNRRVEAMNQLHGHIQDVFNENGVQIMSPHYRADPPAAQVVPPGQWAPPLAPRATPAATDHPPPAGL